MTIDLEKTSPEVGANGTFRLLELYYEKLLDENAQDINEIRKKAFEDLENQKDISITKSPVIVPILTISSALLSVYYLFKTYTTY